MSSPGPSVPPPSRQDAQRPSRPDLPASSSHAAPAGGRTSPRAKDRRRAAPLAKVGMVLFAIGVAAIFTDFLLFAAGSHDLPLWLNLAAMLAPVGLGVGLVGVVKENRAASPALAARRDTAADRS